MPGERPSSGATVSEILDLMKEGGVWMWPVLMLGMLALCVPPVLAVLQLVRVRVPAALWWVFSLAPALPGALGSWLGLRQGYEVLGYVDPDQRGAIAHAATAEGVVAAMTGLAFCGLALGMGAVLATLTSLRSGEDAQDQNAETRLAAAGSLVLGVAALVGASWSYAERSLHRALAFADPSTRSALVAAVEAERGGLAGPVMVAGALLLGGLLLAPVAPRLGRVRVFVSAAIGGVMVLAVATLLGGAWSTMGQLAKFMPEEYTDEIRAAIPDLPRAVSLDGAAGTAEGFSLPIYTRRGDLWVNALDGQAAAPDASPREVALPGATPGLVLIKGMSDADFGVIVESERGLGAVRLSIDAGAEGDASASYANTLVAAEQGAGLSLSCSGCPEITLGALAEAPAKLERLFSAESAADALLIVPGPRWTVQDVVSLCLTAQRRGANSVRCVVGERAPSFGEPVPELPPVAPGQIVFGEPIVLGALDTVEIRKVMLINRARFKYCLENARKVGTVLTGAVTVKYVIDSAGQVSSASVKSSTVDSTPLESCVIDKLQRLRFPEPAGGGVVIVSYPLIFGAD